MCERKTHGRTNTKTNGRTEAYFHRRMDVHDGREGVKTGVRGIVVRPYTHACMECGLADVLIDA